MNVVPLPVNRQLYDRPMDWVLPAWRGLYGADAVRGDYAHVNPAGMREAYDWDGPCVCGNGEPHGLRVSEDRRDSRLTFECEAGTPGRVVHDRFEVVAIAGVPMVDNGGGSSWQPVDLARIVANEDQEHPPALLARVDGIRLLYPGKTHAVSGEPESAKGWLAMLASAQALSDGLLVLYADFEDSPATAVARLLALGVEPEAITGRFRYLQPDEPLAGSEAVLDAQLALQPDLVVIDGVTEALTLEGLNLNDNAEVAEWLKLLPRRAAKAGAAVVTIDHVVKDREARGRFSIGAQHKLAGVDVAYTLEVVEPFGRGREGHVKVLVRKDRPGFVRQHAHGGRVADMRLRSLEDGSVSMTLDAPINSGGVFRPADRSHGARQPRDRGHTRPHQDRHSDGQGQQRHEGSRACRG